MKELKRRHWTVKPVNVSLLFGSCIPLSPYPFLPPSLYHVFLLVGTQSWAAPIRGRYQWKSSKENLLRVIR